MDQIIDDPHEKISIDAGKLNPVADEHFVIRKKNADIEGNTKENCQ